MEVEDKMGNEEGKGVGRSMCGCGEAEEDRRHKYIYWGPEKGSHKCMSRLVRRTSVLHQALSFPSTHSY